MGISIVLPAYKEADNLRELLPKLHTVLDEANLAHNIFVIDTMEPMDDTEAVCKQYNAAYVPRRGGNLYGDAIRTGFAVADMAHILIMDADGSHNPADIPALYAKQKEMGSNLVIGSRYTTGGETDNNFILRFMSYVLNLTYRIVFGLKVKDVSDSFRLYDAAKVKRLQLSCDNFDIVEEILIRLQLENPDFCVSEVPIRFNKRVYGESKRDLVKFIFSYLVTIKRLYGIKRQYKRG